MLLVCLHCKKQLMYTFLWFVNHTSCHVFPKQESKKYTFSCLKFCGFFFLFIWISALQKAIYRIIILDTQVCAALCRPSALKRTPGSILYFYQQSPLVLHASESIQQRPVHADQGGTKVERLKAALLCARTQKRRFCLSLTASGCFFNKHYRSNSPCQTNVLRRRRQNV